MINMANKKNNKQAPITFDIEQYQINEFNRQVNQVKYCSFCGKPLVKADQDEFGQKVDVQWEQLHLAHYPCYAEYERKKKLEAEKPMDWDSYMKEMLEKRKK